MVRFRTRQLFQRIPLCASLNQCETIADRLYDSVGGMQKKPDQNPSMYFFVRHTYVVGGSADSFSGPDAVWRANRLGRRAP